MKLKYFYIFVIVVLAGGGLWWWFRKKAYAKPNLNYQALDIYKNWSLRVPKGNDNGAMAEISAFQEYLGQPITGTWSESDENTAIQKFGVGDIPGFDFTWSLEWLPSEYRREKLINIGITIY
jgi:hypothetical protein